jgi:hypothetical protein
LERVVSEYEELVSEREQMLEQAVKQAEAGKATWDDWHLIRAELGLPRSPFTNLNRSET